ncbi:MAG: YesL family protein [Eubacteriales bacterium]
MNRLFGMDSPLMVALMKIGDLLCLSVLWLVFSLPIFTIGASSTALYAAVFYCLRRNEAGVWKHFWKAFRENFKRSTLAWLIELAVLAVFSLDAAVFRAIRLSGGAMGKLYWAALLLEAVALTWTAYVAAYAARVNGTVGDILRYGLVLLRLHPIRALGVMLPILAGLALCLLVPFTVLFAPAAVCLACSYSLEQVFRLHMQPEDLEKEAAQDALDQKNNF